MITYVEFIHIIFNFYGLDPVIITNSSEDRHGTNVTFTCTANGTRLMPRWIVDDYTVNNGDMFIIEADDKGNRTTTSLTFHTSLFNTTTNVICTFKQVLYMKNISHIFTLEIREG